MVENIEVDRFLMEHVLKDIDIDWAFPSYDDREYNKSQIRHKDDCLLSIQELLDRYPRMTIEDANEYYYNIVADGAFHPDDKFI